MSITSYEEYIRKSRRKHIRRLFGWEYVSPMVNITPFYQNFVFFHSIKTGYARVCLIVGIVVISIFGCPYSCSWPGFHLSVLASTGACYLNRRRLVSTCDTHLVTFARRSSQVRSIHFSALRSSERTVDCSWRQICWFSLLTLLNFLELATARTLPCFLSS